MTTSQTSTAVLYTLAHALDIALMLKCGHGLRLFECEVCCNADPKRKFVGDYETGYEHVGSIEDKQIAVLSPCPVPGPDELDRIRDITDRCFARFYHDGHRWVWDNHRYDHAWKFWRYVEPLVGGLSTAHIFYLPARYAHDHEPQYMAIRPRRGCGSGLWEVDLDDHEYRQVAFIDHPEEEASADGEEVKVDDDGIEVVHEDDQVEVLHGDELTELTALATDHEEYTEEPNALKRGRPRRLPAWASVCVLMLPLPKKVSPKLPETKCEHGMIKARDGVAYGCSICSLWLPKSRYQPNYDDRMKVEMSVRCCGLCGTELDHWQRMYCHGCWKELIWIVRSNKTGSKTEYFTHGAAAKFQELKERPKKIENLPTWSDAWSYFQTYVLLDWWSKADDDVELETIFTMQWLLKNLHRIPSARKFLMRWWLISTGSKVTDIEGVEGVQLKHYFKRSGAEIRALLDERGNPITRLLSIVSP